MILYLTGDEKQSCRELWEEAFPEDSKEFGDYYFREKMKDNRILALIEETEMAIQEVVSGSVDSRQGQVQAMLHRNPYRLAVRERQWNADYLVGVATRKKRRHRGYMRRILVRMMEDMYQEQMPFCFLMPADEAIYRPFGFTFIFRQPWFEWTKVGYELRVKSLVFERQEKEDTADLANVASWMNQWLAKRYQVYAIRDEEYLRRLMEELNSENGILNLFFDGENIVAMESWWGKEKQERRLLYGEEPYVRKVDEKGKPAIMARIIFLKEFVKVIRLRDKEDNKELTISLCLRDPLIAENDGGWLWHLNRETSWMEKTSLGEETDLVLTIEELTSWLFGYQVPEAAVMFDRWIETLNGVFLDEIV